MPAIQPWSAAGAENPMVTLSPESSFELAALLVPPPLLLALELSGVLLVHPVTRAAAPTVQTAVVIRRRKRRCLVADMCFSSRIVSLAPMARSSGGSGRVERQRTGGPLVVLIRGAAVPPRDQVVGPAAAPGVGVPAGLPGMVVPAASGVPPRRPRRRGLRWATRCWRRTAATIITPLATACAELDRLL